MSTKANDLPLLSVITASRGRHSLLRKKAQALASQTLPPEKFEWRIWLNEAPQDVVRVRELLDELDLPYAVHLSGGQAHPVGRARNLAAEAAGGKILLLSDDDCLPWEGSLEAHLTFHESNPGTAGIGQLALPAKLRKGSRREPFERTVRLNARTAWINFTGANSSLAASDFRGVGGYDGDWSGYGGEDHELALRLRANAVRFRYVRDGGATHQGRVWDDYQKAYSAGSAHWNVCERHETGAWALGVHPWLLAVKRLVLNGPWSGFFDPEVLRYERAYAQGARDAAKRSRLSGTGERDRA